MRHVAWFFYYWIISMIVGYGWTCNPPTPPNRSTIMYAQSQGKHKNGSMVVFGCKQGFYLVGNPIIRCIGSTWTKSQFSCVGFCPDVSHIPNGHVVYTNPSVGQAAVEFGCNANFRLVGSPRLECISGQWNGMMPFCELYGPAKSCDNQLGMESKRIPDESITASSQKSDDHSPYFARVDGPKAWCSNPNDKSPYIQIQLDEEKLITAITTQGSQLALSWSRKYEVKDLEKGSWKSYKEKLIGNRNSGALRKNKLDPLIRSQTIRIYPKDPFSLMFHTTYSSCLRLELHGCSATDLRCKRLTINNGRIRQENTFGSVARYRCDPPYTLVGSKKRTCRGNGEWDETAPICKLLCKDPGNITHGERQNDGFELGKQVKYSCLAGFTMQGGSTLTCTKTGAWDKVKPRCTCERTNKQAFRYCRKQCNPDSSSCKDKQCVCDGDCGYSCVPKVVNCGKPSALQNGIQQYSSTAFGSTVRYQCDKPYTLIGSKIRTCRAIRRWDGTEPLCTIDCGVLPTPDKGEKVMETYTRVGGVVRFKCNEKGYEISGSEIRTCQNDGLWSGFPTLCKIKSCGDPGTPLNGAQVNVKNGYNYGSSVEFTCNENYTLSERRKIYCEETKDWSSPIPRCWAPCPDPGVPGNGSRLDDDFRHGQSVTFKCKDDYKLKGKETISCNDGKWSDYSPECTGPCPDPGVPVNGRRIGDDFRHGESVTFVCDYDFELKGNAPTTCDYGRWADDIPQCKVITCPDPGSPKHGRQTQVSNNFAVGGFVRFKCDENYIMTGKGKLTCKRDKTWNENIPKCLAPCVDPGDPVNGRRIGSVFVHDSVVQFQCYGDRFLKGSSEMKCDNGNWDAKLPTCIDCNGGIPLGMRSGDIPDKSITVSSQTAQHPAYHGRLGTDTYWCSNDEKTSYIEIRLPKRYKITEARVKITQNSEQVQSIALGGEIFPEQWIDFHFEQRPYNSDVERIVPQLPFIAQSLKITIKKQKKVPVCLKAEVYGCEIPRGCILQGSAVLTKENFGYSKGYLGGFLFGYWEVFLVGKTGSIMTKKRGFILDEKAIVHDLVKGITSVVGEDVNSPDSIRQGIIEQIGDSVCTIRSNDERWISKLVDIRVAKISKLCK